MAFTSAGGYGNLPNGNFSPVIYSKQVQLAFRKASVVEAITNSDYFGEIANMGDSVKIIKEPEITVKAYERGTTITPQDLDDEDMDEDSLRRQNSLHRDEDYDHKQGVMQDIDPNHSGSFRRERIVNQHSNPDFAATMDDLDELFHIPT